MTPNIGEDNSTTSSKVLDARELRIGNWLQQYSTQFQVTGEDIEKFQRSCKTFTTHLYSTFQPIELSEEWLKKAGFEKDDSGVEIGHEDYCEWYEKLFPLIGRLVQSSNKEYLFDEDTDTLRIKYVHQLQNLFYALTGNELIFNHG